MLEQKLCDNMCEQKSEDTGKSNKLETLICITKTLEEFSWRDSIYQVSYFSAFSVKPGFLCVSLCVYSDEGGDSCVI